MRRVVACLVLVAFASPSGVGAQPGDNFPRVVEKGDQQCLQVPDEGRILEYCSDSGLMERLRPVDLGTSLPIEQKRRWSNDPRATARRHAREDGHGRFGTGFAAGLFFGLVGTVLAGVVVNGSTVEVPPPHPEYSADAQWEYRYAYSEEARSARSSSAIAGGVLGSIVGAGLIVLIIYSANSQDK